MLERQAARAQLDRAAEHRMDDLFGRGAAQLDRHGAGLRLHPLQGLRQQADRQRGGGGQQQRLGVAARDLGRAQVDLLQAAQGALHVFIEQEALLGGRHAGAVAGEQRIADLGFQFLHQPGHRRLRARQQPRGAGHAAGRHDGGEGLKLPQFHGS